MKLTILGGGGFRTPYIYHALRDDPGQPRVTELTLFDPSEQRLRAIQAVLAQLGDPTDSAPRVSITTDARAAIADADFVFAAVRVGGLEGRRCDEHIARDLGVLGQETIGAGGVAFALRTVPVMLQYARLIAELAPDAYVLNFTNPAGVITEAMQSVLGERVIGICDTPSGLCRRVSQTVGIPMDELQFDYVGLNHLGWLSGIRHDDRDLLPGLLADDGLLGSLEESHIFGPKWIRALRAIPNEYLYYYYHNRKAVQSGNNAAQTRGDYLARSQAELFTRLEREPERAATAWLAAVRDRNASYMADARGSAASEEVSQEQLFAEGYAEVAVAVMRAIARDEQATMILNVRNGDTVAGLPADAVVEVPTLVSATGARALATASPSLHQIGLMQQEKAVHRHVIRAAMHGDESEALKAFALHPLVDSISVGQRLLDRYVQSTPGVARALRAR